MQSNIEQTVDSTKNATLERRISAIRYLLKVDPKTEAQLSEYQLLVFSRIFDAFKVQAYTMKDLSLTLSAIATSELSPTAKLPTHSHKKLKHLIRLVLLSTYNMIAATPAKAELMNVLQLLNALSKLSLDYQQSLSKKTTLCYYDCLSQLLNRLNNILHYSPAVIKASEIKVILTALSFIAAKLKSQSSVNFFNHPVLEKLICCANQSTLYSSDDEKEQIPMILVHLKKLGLKALACQQILSNLDNNNPFIRLPYLYFTNRAHRNSYSVKNLTLIADQISDLPIKDCQEGMVICHKFLALACENIHNLEIASVSIQSSSMLLLALARSSYKNDLSIILSQLKQLYNKRNSLADESNFINLHATICAIAHFNFDLKMTISETPLVSIKDFLGELLKYYMENLNASYHKKIKPSNELQAKHYAHFLMAITKYSVTDLTSCLHPHSFHTTNLTDALLTMIDKKARYSTKPIALLNGLDRLSSNHEIHYSKVIQWNNYNQTFWEVITRCVRHFRDMEQPLNIKQLSSITSSLTKLRIDLSNFELTDYLFKEINKNFSSSVIKPVDYVAILHFLTYSHYEQCTESDKALNNTLKSIDQSYDSLEIRFRINILSNLTSLREIKKINFPLLNELTRRLVEYFSAQREGIDDTHNYSELFTVEIFYSPKTFNIPPTSRISYKEEAKKMSNSSVSEGWVQYCLEINYSEFSFLPGHYCEKTNRVIDFALILGDKKIAIEVDGESHLIPETEDYTIKTQFRNQALTMAGWIVVIIPIWQTNARNQQDNITRWLGDKLSPQLPNHQRAEMTNYRDTKKHRFLSHEASWTERHSHASTLSSKKATVLHRRDGTKWSLL